MADFIQRTYPFPIISRYLICQCSVVEGLGLTAATQDGSKGCSLCFRSVLLDGRVQICFCFDPCEAFGIQLCAVQ